MARIESVALSHIRSSYHCCCLRMQPQQATYHVTRTPRSAFAIDLGVAARLFFDFVEVAHIGDQRVVGLLVGPVVRHFIKDSTPSSASTRRSDMQISRRSLSPSAALAISPETCHHEGLWRYYVGKCSSIAAGMVRGRGGSTNERSTGAALSGSIERQHRAAA